MEASQFSRLEELTHQLLDKIDIVEVMENAKIIPQYMSDLMALITTDKTIQDILETPEYIDFEGDPFNFINAEEFADYLRDRYRHRLMITPINDYEVYPV